MTDVLSDLRVLYHLLVRPVRGRTHAQRMENFYQGQAHVYDQFRERLLKGRDELFAELPCPRGGLWVDLGGGTGLNLERLGDRLRALNKVYVVDLATSLLRVAQQRAANRGWPNVETVHADATTFQPREGAVDVVTFSYSLTMIPDWFAAIENALAMLKPGAVVGVADFYVSRKHPAPQSTRHSWSTRSFWPAWFAGDNVFLSADHLPFLQRHFEQIACTEGTTKLPYVPGVRVPYYTFVGRKRFLPTHNGEDKG